VKRFKDFKKLIIILLTLSMSMFLFAGCQSNSTSSKNSSQSSSGGKKFNKDEIKKRYEDKLQAFVKDGTINQDQSNKILDSLTGDINNRGGNRRKQNNEGNNQNNSQENNSGANETNRPRNNPLSKLVSDGVITQQQADKIMEGLRGNGRSSNNNSNESNK
jgi:polyhydroxyalkanoate synthesis regulator phasin